MSAKRSLQPLDVATGLLSGTLAAALFTLAAVSAATPDDAVLPVVVDAAGGQPATTP
jgi:hypothetical protein